MWDTDATREGPLPAFRSCGAAALVPERCAKGHCTMRLRRGLSLAGLWGAHGAAISSSADESTRPTRAFREVGLPLAPAVQRIRTFATSAQPPRAPPWPSLADCGAF
jgi:hypothetical protein